MATFDAEEFDWLTPFLEESLPATTPMEEFAIASTGEGFGGEVAVVSAPVVSKIAASGLRSIDVTFSREMANTPEILDPSKYVFTGGIAALSVARLAVDSVRVTIDQDVLDEVIYQLTVNP